ncbi:MAG: L,D-transpeptidase family protein [Bacilli bacterium]|nr:L,D-transpeptidase family protein [Bacilli bacterium]
MKQVLENVKSKQYLVADHQERKLGLYEDGQLVHCISNVVFGKNGCTYDKVEGDGCTPLGDFPLGFAFGLDDVSFLYPYYQITPNAYFVSDSNSKFYNEWVWVLDEEQTYPYSYMKSSKQILWDDAEHLSDYEKTYWYGIVIEYNMNPKEKNKGSAIFLHVKNKDYTEGCVAVTKSDMEYILKWIKVGARILIQ